MPKNSLKTFGNDNASDSKNRKCNIHFAKTLTFFLVYRVLLRIIVQLLQF